MLGTDIVTRVRLVANDNGTVLRAADADFALFLTDGIQYIGAKRPDAICASATVTLAAGSRQSLSSFSPAGQRLLEVYRSNGSRAVRCVDRNELDSQNPSWHADTASATIYNYCYDDRDPTTFWVYPPATAGATLDLLYAKALTALTAGTLNTTLALSDQFIDPLVNYVLSRYYDRDAEDDANSVLSDKYRKRCDDFLEGKNRTDLEFSPDLNNPGGVVNKSASVGGI